MGVTILLGEGMLRGLSEPNEYGVDWDWPAPPPPSLMTQVQQAPTWFISVSFSRFPDSRLGQDGMQRLGDMPDPGSQCSLTFQGQSYS